MIKRILLAALAIGIGTGLSAAANAATISTIFASNNNGSAGGAVYFDITVAGNAVDVTGFTTNTSSTGAFTWSVYLTAAGTSAFGNEANLGAWTLVSTGSGTGAGVNLASAVALNNPFTLQASTTYGMALVIGSAGHNYTNGTGSNQAYSNADVALAFGSATNVPFTAPAFNPRVWNGSITYDVNTVPGVPEPTSLLLLGGGLVGLALIRRRKL